MFSRRRTNWKFCTEQPRAHNIFQPSLLIAPRRHAFQAMHDMMIRYEYLDGRLQNAYEFHPFNQFLPSIYVYISHERCAKLRLCCVNRMAIFNLHCDVFPGNNVMCVCVRVGVGGPFLSTPRTCSLYRVLLIRDILIYKK